METIEIEKDVFLKMINTLFNEVTIEQQVAWLQQFGTVFYEKELYDFIESKHIITPEFFQKVAANFWDKEEVMFQEIPFSTIAKAIEGIFYQKYLGFSFDAKKTADDIDFTLEDYGKEASKRYFSPMLFHCLAATYNFKEDTAISFTKVMLPNYEMTIVFSIKTVDGVKYMDFSQEPW